MANFATVTRKETLTPQVVNLDTVEMIDIVPADALPPLDSNLPITAAHIPSAVLHFSSGRPPMAILEGDEDLQKVVKADVSPEASKALREAHEKKIADLNAKRAKERVDAEKAALAAKHKEAEKELDARAATTSTSAGGPQIRK